VEVIAISESDNKYREMGFKCGLEIHQQLLTQRKLFCRCPAYYRNDKPEGEIIRHMRPTLSELGEYDGTALMEFKTKKNVIYQLYRDNACTYEMDDTPPFPINAEALDIAFKLAMLLNCAIVDELHVSRKQYLDGSIPTGFQRTAIVGVDGWVPYKGRKITITHLCLEEDACREISDKGHDIVFRTDRLSMPLLEVITGPDMQTPREAMEVNELLGRILKASGLVRRGIGSVRQDVNVSINGGQRAEIKGVPQTWMVEKLTSIEAERQAALLQIKEALRLRGINEKTIHGEKIDLAPILKDTKIPIIQKAFNNGWSVKGIKIDGFAGVLSWPMQPGKTFTDELSGRIQVIACLDDKPNLAVSDIPHMAGFTPEDWQIIRKACDCKYTDAMVVVWGAAADVQTALSEIKIRAIEATKGVPNETRQAHADGTTGFERILPGADRMYPDTDSPPVEITGEWISRLRAELPEPAYKIEERLVKAGVPESIVIKVVVSPYLEVFEKIYNKLKLSPELIWSVLRNLNIKDRENLKIYNGELVKAFEAYKSGDISKDALYAIFKQIGAGCDKTIRQLIADYKTIDIKNPEVQDSIQMLLKETSNGVFHDETKRIHFICGRMKDKYANRLDGASLYQEIALKASK
jgi:glutamyl-tRNA(Gln) amidotransferase subunit E